MRSLLRSLLTETRPIGDNMLADFREDFRNTAAAGVPSPWINANLTYAIDSVVAPDGTTTGDTGTASSTLGSAYREQAVLPDTQYTFSFFSLAGTLTAPLAAIYNVTGAAFIFSGIPYVPGVGGFVRKAIQFKTPPGCVLARTYALRFSGSTGTISFWGAKLELGPVATPYVANSGRIVS